MGDWSRLNALLAFVSITALVFGAVAVIVPATLPPAVAGRLTALEQSADGSTVLIGISAVVFLFGLWRTYFSGASDVHDAGVAGQRSTTDRPPDADVVGARTSERVDRTIAALKRDETADTEPIVEDVRASLRAIETARGYSGVRRENRIRRGTWTDDRIAATFLGDETAGSLSIWHRLRLWLFPGWTFERRLERTLAELERYASTDVTRNGRTDTDDSEGDDA
ncbi:DUF7269 family protein [Natronobacterium gregoryi]|uniref:Uncharacterized protein n=2 Tax=Natronobacterium gregoryi TaxID=44930 RepID=L0AHN5_NATGS|nr:hypothetical protein [Natronobacterium gregoryi]AFZ72570.1 hypothetical protein Natgr_1359 [Natronobacterium gregoryi SP2]ELY71911.1 hypothetical protein C490_04537 [Natronobacterium gregoryi SP2]PLK19349.1 hypothetical protein CYV19_15380 [Natronobacterium gregoryi SP2]SFJ52259.1 hypothetical protein SAMN05443661_13612 [Natronobacterium gregoryi]